ncbi:MAG: YqgE/AlgH family protein [Betaproteobacteria bacterium]|nr:YqgE/AlgH family protein [Betaproteobacteria bacterium]
MDTIDLTGHFLIAMPGMEDTRFARTLTFVCKHDEDGALGVIVNRPIDMRMSDLFSQTGLTSGDTVLSERPLYFGGPVETERGFVLHQTKGDWQSTLMVGDQLALTTSRDILDALAQGGGPERFMVVLGYAGWHAEQLENEVAQNAWLTVPAQADVIFDLPVEARLDAATHLLGVDYSSLSNDAGHA